MLSWDVPDKDVDAHFGEEFVDIFKMRLEMVLIARYHVERVVVGSKAEKEANIIFVFDKYK